MKKFFFPLILLLLFASSCKPSAEKTIKDGVAREYYSDGMIKSETQVKDTLAHGLMKNYDRDGNLSSVYTFNMGKLNGPAVSYYTNGKIEMKMYYKDGRREGTTQLFYRTGELYRETPFKAGKIDGLRKSYYKNGTIMAEAPYKNSMPGVGLKEYTSKGELISDDTRIVVREENRLFGENKYILHITLDHPKKGVNYYLGDLVEGKYLSPFQWQIPEVDNVGNYIVKLERGSFRMETLIISATYKTPKSNYNVISRKYNLAVDNK
ncbi:MAG: toxin-antitoxin system YwqK family antitoxin [Bacteroidales bacterium]|nr:toxin-antitoxin system YwqK family antitoxin [Bacteroidales bacterium]MCB9013557.1 toxin-antitoxin system YwqK family antitoxin [Bacteroidales bacterium]